MKIPTQVILQFAFVLLIAVLACASPVLPSAAPDTAQTSAAPATEAGPSATATRNPNAPGELPSERSSHAGDQDSSQTAGEHRAPGGDRFTFGRFERPFNADTMDTYYPYVDIVETFYYQDATWVYAAILLKQPDGEQKLSGKYALEIDLDVDGGGDWLILASDPQPTDWSKAGVQVWYDSNDDVGGQTTINADGSASGGDGYETLKFDQGQGDDADLAWARSLVGAENVVQIAVKRSIFAGDENYLAGVWAGGAILDPALFDLNDHFTHEQAGAALADLEFFYPIKAISELDNACRVAIGFQPTGGEPGLCPIEQQKGSCPSDTYYCVNFGQTQVCYCVP